jgi:uncharacterized protein (TIGR03086 family)
MALSDQPAERHRQIAGTFAERVRGTQDWDAPSPVAGWTARAVVGHLTSWFPAFLAGGAGIELPAADPDPVRAWQAQADAVQALLGDPGDRIVSNPHTGDVPLAVAIDRFYTADVFMHTWDLARATGQDDRLDADFCAQLYAGMLPIAELLQSSGQYGAPVPVPDDADAQTMLLGFIGRDPDWRRDKSGRDESGRDESGRDES